MSEDNPKYSGERDKPNRSLVSYEELIISNMLEIQALIRILEKKGITDETEILSEVRQLKLKMEEKLRRNQMEN